MAITGEPGTGVPASFSGPVTRIDTVRKEPLGQLRYEGGKWYKYVKYLGGAGPVSGIAGRVAGYRLLDGYKLNEVTLNTSDHIQGLAAGVLQAALLDTNFGWVQVRGFAVMTVAFAGGVDGDAMTLIGATADIGDLDVNIATAANTHICAHAGEAATFEIVCEFPF